MVFWRPHCRRCRRILRSLFRPATEKSEVWVWYTLSRGIWWRKGATFLELSINYIFWIRKVSFWPVRKRIGIYTPFFFDNLWSLNFVEWWRFAEDIKWERENKPRKKTASKKKLQYQQMWRPNELWHKRPRTLEHCQPTLVDLQSLAD